MKNRNVDNISIRGYSHLLSNKECQDSSISWRGKKYSAVIISDGHGGEKYYRSAKGSEIACGIGKDVISMFMEKIRSEIGLYNDLVGNATKREKMLLQLERSIIQRWNDEIEADLSSAPFEGDERFSALSDTDKESVTKTSAKAYGATFIAAVVAEKYFFILKLGDGNVCVLKDNVSQMFFGLSDELKDDQLQFNLTTSLCSSDADKEFKHCFVNTDKDHPEKNYHIDGLILTTDGIINSYTSEQAYLDFMGNIFSGYKEETLESAHAELKEFLPRLSEKGSGDDLTVGIIIK